LLNTGKQSGDVGSTRIGPTGLEKELEDCYLNNNEERYKSFIEYLIRSLLKSKGKQLKAGRKLKLSH